MVIKLVFNEHKAVTYMCQFFLKTKDQCLQVMKQADKLKLVAKAYLSKKECFVQEAVNLFCQNEGYEKIFPDVYFVNTSLSEERVQVLLSEKEVRKLTDDSANILKKTNIDYYTEIPCIAFCNGKYMVLNDFCYEEFFAYYSLDSKSNKTDKTCLKQTQSKMNPLILCPK